MLRICMLNLEQASPSTRSPRRSNRHFDFCELFVAEKERCVGHHPLVRTGLYKREVFGCDDFFDFDFIHSRSQSQLSLCKWIGDRDRAIKSPTPNQRLAYQSRSALFICRLDEKFVSLAFFQAAEAAGGNGNTRSEPSGCSRMTISMCCPAPAQGTKPVVRLNPPFQLQG